MASPALHERPAEPTLSDPERPVILWFRDDLRISDNPALNAAAATGRKIICIFVHDEESPGLRPLGGAARWWLHGSLEALDGDLRRRGAWLSIYRGRAQTIILALAAETNAAAIFWNRRYGGAERLLDETLKSALKERRIAAKSFNGHLLHEPWAIRTKAGQPFRVFSAFWRAAQDTGDPVPPLTAPAQLEPFRGNHRKRLRAVTLADLSLEPSTPDWASGLRSSWQRGEQGAHDQLGCFLDKHFGNYAGFRDYPDRAATSRLSPYLRFGNISPRQLWHAAAAATHAEGHGTSYRNLEKFQTELGWREFSYHLLYRHPDLADRNLQPQFDAMPWRVDPQALRAWQTGRTGYPFVDAGMRELWHTGWMHNRVRMIVASFLVKHLLIDWRQGEQWFWDTLVDADPANNPASWQWVAGSGADAAPYFRVFNPVLQGEKFDPDGAYIRRWLPELSGLPSSSIHRPGELEAITAGYPERIVEHKRARARALEAYKNLRTTSAPGHGRFSSSNR
ncbi:deoxyribodipyrimidine photo-lyase [Sphingomonas sp.]|uniref:cryptochrome/photolyase family protein n=1 Tax=Sphingomonas sp. TaxID=28214 RepID=UPI002579FC6A|nr:deoxyribodipyrimidine photo-lyase [Sphingomonas sp.]